MGEPNKLAFFAAYPSAFSIIGDCFSSVSTRLKLLDIDLHLWKQNDNCGIPLTDPIFSGIDSVTALIADITRLNYNVTFEIGYAIAKRKRVFLVRNTGIKSDKREIEQVGIFDTLGYKEYENSEQLKNLLVEFNNFTPMQIDYAANTSTPLYLIELPRQTEFMGRIKSRIKKSALRYKSFNPSENVRLSASEAIEYTCKALGLIIPMAPDTMVDGDVHNIRAAFVAGLGYGLEKPTLLLQDYGGPMPLDVRDMVKTIRNPDEINDHVADLALRVIEAIQGQTLPPHGNLNALARLSIGDPMAENEFQTLGGYFLQTDAYNRTVRGEANLVVGRKGTGKTALFSQVRDAKRKDKKNIICDLKPEGYQLIRLKEEILENLNEGSRQYMITAFWEYIIYLEIVYKILEKDQYRYTRDHTIHEKYVALKSLYQADEDIANGDFSERLLHLSERIVSDYKKDKSMSGTDKLSDGQITNLLYKHDLRKLRDLLVDYLFDKGEVWVLFDNLDKGWPPEGLQPIDTVILRCLIDAGKKMQRELRNQDIDFHCVVFVRNDVYELFMQNSADYGKEIRVSLDWSDRDQLAELLRRRIVVDSNQPDISFEAAWRSIAVPLQKGENAFHFLIDRSLMRPRNIIKEVMHCKAAAVNMGHEKIETSDIDKGMLDYSHDVLIEADRELSDIDTRLSGFLYTLIAEPAYIQMLDLWKLLEVHKVPIDQWEKATDCLIYFGFFGVVIGDAEPKYVFDYNYNANLMKALMEKNEKILRLCINPAFWPALETKVTDFY
ncbi:MAG: P-loop ATPase, Sll1717 family [Acidimicrobiales bacterium]